MNRRARVGLLAAGLLVATGTSAGCGSARTPATARLGPARPPSLATALVTPTAAWAVAVLGGPAARRDSFWQLFVRPATARRWRLATPPGVASNGGLVLAAARAAGTTDDAAGLVVAGFRPSQHLAFSPLATSRDQGTSWTPGLLDAVLADVPDALAAAPGGGRLLAALSDGSAELSGPGGAGWRPLVTLRTLAMTAAGIRCGPGRLTAAAFSSSGAPLLATSCARPEVTGIFGYAGGAWHRAGPVLPAAYTRHGTTVLRLTTTAGLTTALLTAGTGPAARLLAAWSRRDGHWALSAPLRLRGAQVTSASPGPGGTMAVILDGRRAQVTAAQPGTWHPLPALPAGTATLAPAPPGDWDALAVHGTTVTVWQAAAGARGWTGTQVISVPIRSG